MPLTEERAYFLDRDKDLVPTSASVLSPKAQINNTFFLKALMHPLGEAHWLIYGLQEISHHWTVMER